MSFAVRTILFSAVPFVFIAHAAHSFEAKGQLQRFGVRLTEILSLVRANNFWQNINFFKKKHILSNTFLRIETV